MKRILIAGAGALGSVFGAFLRRAGYPVTLLGRPEHLDAIRQRGLHVDGIWGDFETGGFDCVTAASALVGSFELVLVPVKSYDTEAVTTAVVPYLAADGVVVSLQNGLGNVEKIEAIAGPERTLGARVIFGATLPAPGRARVTVFADPNALGPLRAGVYPARDALAREWAQRIDAAGVPTQYTDQLAAKLWAKVFYNAALNPLGALLRVHYGALPERDDSRAIMDRVIDEVFAVARAEGVALPWADAATYREEFYSRLVPVTHDHRSSMLQDLERGRRTEIEAINGEVWRRGSEHGVPTPANELMCRLLRLRQLQGDVGPSRRAHSAES